MVGRLWCVRLLLLTAVSGIVLSPLAVSGASPSSQPVEWNHHPSALTLPSSAAYPAVVIYRDVRISLADRSFEKAELLLEFSNQDAAAINMMVRRHEYVTAAGHFTTYQDALDRCIAWLLMADDSGNNVSYLLSRVKSDHLAQQSALAEAVEMLPEWALEGVGTTRTHVAEEILHAIQILEGDEAVVSYAALMASAHPELSGLVDTEIAPDKPPTDSPSIEEASPETAGAESSSIPMPSGEADTGPRISALNVADASVEPGESTTISCVLAAGGADTDELRYSWWCSRGGLMTDGSQTTWIAPDRSGTYEISVTVTDTDGRSDTRSIEVRVGDDGDGLATLDEKGAGDAADPEEVDKTEEDSTVSHEVKVAVTPEIRALTASADHHYLDQNLSGAYAILVSRDAELHCEVADADALSFEWTVTGGGKITGSGDTVILTAPPTRGNLTVTVTVTNEIGETDSRSLTFHVTTCQVCFV